jgi:hypothetical protein
MNANERKLEPRRYAYSGVHSRPFADKGKTTNEHK